MISSVVVVVAVVAVERIENEKLPGERTNPPIRTSSISTFYYYYYY